MRFKLVAATAILTMLGACGKTNPSGTPQTATVTLKDGSAITGSVTKSDTSSITVQSANGVVSTYPMSQVSSVNYGPSPAENQASQPPANPAPASPAPATPPPAAAQNTPPPAPVSPEPAGPPPQPAPTYRTIPAGATIEVRSNDTIDGQTAAVGHTYSAVVVRNVMAADGGVAIPHGATATLVVRDANRQGKVQGQSDLAVDVGAVEIAGHRYRLETSDFVQQGKQGLGTNKRTAEFTGGGGVLGTILGAVAGGGKGAAIGALSGAAAGVATQSLTRGKAVRIPAETVMRFRLEAPVHIREMR
jgi:hypothetical protein